MVKSRIEHSTFWPVSPTLYQQSYPTRLYHKVRQSGRQVAKQADKQAGRLLQRCRQTDRHAAKQTDKQTERQTGRQVGRQRCRQRCGQTDKHADRYWDRQEPKLSRLGTIVWSCVKTNSMFYYLEINQSCILYLVVCRRGLVNGNNSTTARHHYDRLAWPQATRDLRLAFSACIDWSLHRT
jgi:hypothetical protein